MLKKPSSILAYVEFLFAAQPFVSFANMEATVESLRLKIRKLYPLRTGLDYYKIILAMVFPKAGCKQMPYRKCRTGEIPYFSFFSCFFLEANEDNECPFICA